MKIFNRSKYILIFVFLILSIFTVSVAFSIGTLPKAPIISTSAITPDYILATNTQFTINGTADLGVDVRVYRVDTVKESDQNRTFQGKVRVVDNRKWNLNVILPNSGGKYIATATDISGNTSVDSNLVHIDLAVIASKESIIAPQIQAEARVEKDLAHSLTPVDGGNNPAGSIPTPEKTPSQDDPATGVLGDDDELEENDDDQPKRDRRPSGAVDSNEPAEPTISDEPAEPTISDEPAEPTISDEPAIDNAAPIAITKFINTNFIGCVIKPSDTIIGYTNPIKAGKLVTLDGSGSSDPEGGALTYSWKQLGDLEDGRKVTLSDPNSVNPTFTTKALMGSDFATGKTLFHQVVFKLTVTDDNDGVSALVPQMNKSLISLTILPSDFNVDCSASDEVADTGTPATNVVPTITGTPATTVDKDVAYSFVPTGNDVDSDTLTYSITNKPTWATLDPTTGGLTGTPTSDNIGITRGIVISVTDGTAIASLSAFDLEVIDTNDGPIDETSDPVEENDNDEPAINTALIARAEIAESHFISCLPNYPRAVSGGQLITLDGSKSSDTEGGELTYSWEQVGNVKDSNRVTLSDPTAKKPTFTTPERNSLYNQLVFQLTVTDTEGKNSAFVPKLNKSLTDLTVIPVGTNCDSANVDEPTVSHKPANKRPIAVARAYKA